MHLISCNMHCKVETQETSQILFLGNLQNVWQQGLDLTVLHSTLRLTWPSEASNSHWLVYLWVLICYNFQPNPTVYHVLTPSWLLYIYVCHYKKCCLWVFWHTERLLNVWSIIKLLRREFLPFTLACTSHWPIIPPCLPGESWSSYLLNLIEGVGVRAMLKILDDFSLRLTGATSPHRNQTGSCAECAVKTAQLLSLMALSMMMRAGIRTAGH